MEAIKIMPTLPKALRADDECTVEGEDCKFICSYVVHDYGSAEEASSVEVIAVELDFGGRNTISADVGHFSNDLLQVLEDECQEHCDKQENARRETARWGDI